MSEVKTKMVKLAKAVKPDVSLYEALRLEIAANNIKVPTKDAIQKSLAEVLNESEGTVREKLSEHADADRVLDELIAHLDSATDNR